VDLGGRQVQSVSGGGHWGGGVFIHAEDQARIGSYQPAASRDSFFAIGAGGNVTWIDPTHDFVAVLRWIDSTRLDDWIGQVLAALVR